MENQLIAHVIFSENGNRRIQTLVEHCRNVARLCAEACRPIGLENLGYLTGLLHDMGKAATPVQEHLWQQTKQKLNHSAAEMRWLWEVCRTGGTARRLTAQIAAIAIGCHHSGRCDCIAPDGSEPWLERMYSSQAQPMYEESVEAFFSSCCTKEEVLTLVGKAVKEISTIYKRLSSVLPAKPGLQGNTLNDALRFALGFMQRFLFSALVDADWTDTSCFMDNKPLPQQAEGAQRQSIWNKLSENTEDYLNGLPAVYSIDSLRREISNQCLAAARERSPGIYRLYIPTGGGKTYSGLRFCIEMARRQNAQHIFYFSPYKSITRQNADCIRNALGEEFVLEHHSDLTFEESEEEAREQWLAQSQRWQGTPVICTTMVQFLNSLFAAPRQNVRRLSALAGSVLLFDEIQSLPLQHVCLFNLAVNTLAHLLGCTAVLCTATQPELAQAEYPVAFSPDMDIVTDYEERFRQFRRTRIIPRLVPGGERAPAIADFIMELLKENRSILVILNTKSAVNKLYEALEPQMPEDTPLFCLTTYLCSKHREDVIRQITRRLSDKQPVVCISTQLIEAGVDLSFDCVVRSMAGLPSIAQAAGRCNRHGEDGWRPVYLIDCADENLTRLKEIDNARQATRRLLESLPEGSDLLSPQIIQAYYGIYYGEPQQRLGMRYPVPEVSSQATLVDLLSSNRDAVQAYTGEGHPEPDTGKLRQAFGTAEALFDAIPDETVPVLVPYKEGAEKLLELQSGRSNLQLSSLQPYTVSISRGELNRLGDAVHPILNGAVLALQEGFYDEAHKGLLFSPSPLPELMY